MKETSHSNLLITYDDDATWLVTYADLMTILLVFFVLLYSLAFFEKEKYEERVEIIMRQLKQDKISKGGIELFDLSADLNRKISLEDITGLRSREAALFKTMNKFVKKAHQGKDITTRLNNGKIILTVSGETLFSSGSARLNPGALPAFNRMIQIFDEFPEFTINIKGHTDNIPISTRVFPSNWELSAIRATTVLKYLVSKGIRPQRLTATGYGDIMPMVPNTTEENRKTKQTIKPKQTDLKNMVDNQEQREAFRYIFKEEGHLTMDFKHQTVKVLNISAGGLAFNGDGFAQYDVDQITLFLDIPNYRGETRFTAQLRILNISAGRICHCIFENCNIEDYEIIHKYVLEMQKTEMINNSRNCMQ